MNERLLTANSLLLGLLIWSSFTQALASGADGVDLATNLRQRERVEQKQKEYNQVYDYYLEACASSQWLPRFSNEKGTNFGHTFMMIRGACKDTEAVGTPQLKLCGPNSIVGISTDSEYKKLNWTVVESREFMLYGDHPADKAFTKDDYKNLIREAADRGVFENVDISVGDQQKAKDAGQTHAQWLAEFSFATDFALTLGRGVTCTRIPLSGTRSSTGPLQKVIHYLNSLNKKAYESAMAGTGGFEYNYVVNNCAHPTANTLATLGLARGRNTAPMLSDTTAEQFKRRLDAAVPYNVMLEGFQRGNNFDLGQIKKRLQKDPSALKALLELGWIPQQAGVIIEDIQPHGYQNDVFNPVVTRDFFSMMDQMIGMVNKSLPLPMQIIPEIQSDVRLYNKLMKKPKTTVLFANLTKWKKIYTLALHDKVLANNDGIDLALKNYLREKLVEIDRGLEKLSRFN